MTKKFTQQLDQWRWRQDTVIRAKLQFKAYVLLKRSKNLKIFQSKNRVNIHGAGSLVIQPRKREQQQVYFNSCLLKNSFHVPPKIFSIKNNELHHLQNLPLLKS